MADSAEYTLQTVGPNPVVRKKLLIATPLKQDPVIFAEYQKCLDRLKPHPDWHYDRFYIVNNCDEIIPFIRNASYVKYEFRDEKLGYHAWSRDLVHHMAVMRNYCLSYARTYNYDAILLADTDEMLDPYTALQLIEDDLDIVYVKHFTQDEGDNHTWVNVYEINNGTYYDYDTMNAIWQNNDHLQEVGGGGGITWISRKVLENTNVNYSPLDNLTYNYMSGEDKCFCTRAHANGFKIYMEPRLQIYHLNRPFAVQQYLNGKDTIEWDKVTTTKNNTNGLGFR